MPFWCLQFPPKNKRKQVNLRYRSGEVKIVCSFFGGIVGLKKSLELYLTFRYMRLAFAILRTLMHCNSRNLQIWLPFQTIFYNEHNTFVVKKECAIKDFKRWLKYFHILKKPLKISIEHLWVVCKLWPFPFFCCLIFN